MCLMTAYFMLASVRALYLLPMVTDPAVIVEVIFIVILCFTVFNFKCFILD